MKLIKGIAKLTDIVVFTLFAVLVVLVLLQVFTRFANVSQVWIDEVAKFIFVWLTYLGGAITVRRGMNIAFDLILDGLHGKAYRVLFTIVNLLCLAFMIAVGILGAKAAWANRVQSSTMVHVNMGLMNCAIPLGFLLMAGSQVEYYFRHLKERAEEEAAAEKGGDAA